MPALPQIVRYLAAFTICVFSACNTHKQIAATVVREKTLIGEQSAGWLKYKIYMLPGDTSRNGKQKDNLVLSIMIINMQDNTSPLRKLCANLDDYNQYYEYLLNSCKNDIVLQAGNKRLYPVYYAFENNYDAFPFETINVGFESDRTNKGLNHLKNPELIYADKVFSHDTITCPLHNPNR
jgi:hypothetical protein